MMRRLRRSFWSDRRGSAVALVAVSLTALVSLLALGIDVGMLFNARSEAQRAADSSALAGASAFLDYPAEEAKGPARERALEYAIENRIRKEYIDASEVTVHVNVDSAAVTVLVRRAGVPTWFARMLGREDVPIGAQATAQAVDAGTAQCLKPFAVPDMWEETNDDTNGNRIWDDGESWDFDLGRDRYEGYTGADGSSTETGYGSGWRNAFSDTGGNRYRRDYGRRIMIKASDPHDAFVPSFFYPWVLPVDAGQPDCGADRAGNDLLPGNGKGKGKGKGNGNGKGGTGTDTGGTDGGVTDPGNGNGNAGGNGNGNAGGNGNGNAGGNGKGKGNGNGDGTLGGKDNGKGRGGAAYRRNICSCNASVIDLETEYLIEPGNMIGPTFQGVSALIEQDRDAYWDEGDNRVVSDYGDDSPRVITVALFDPTEVRKGGRQYIQFNNFARFFIEAQESPQDPVVGRFMYYVAATGAASKSGTKTGSLVKRLRLIR
jgi:hypothetical protein